MKYNILDIIYLRDSIRNLEMTGGTFLHTTADQRTQESNAYTACDEEMLMLRVLQKNALKKLN